jgi:hypothetical protein
MHPLASSTDFNEAATDAAVSSGRRMIPTITLGASSRNEMSF